jgi:hypothetical protein
LFNSSRFKHRWISSFYLLMWINHTINKHIYIHIKNSNVLKTINLWEQQKGGMMMQCFFLVLWGVKWMLYLVCKYMMSIFRVRSSEIWWRNVFGEQSLIIDFILLYFCVFMLVDDIIFIIIIIFSRKDFRKSLKSICWNSQAKNVTFHID